MGSEEASDSPLPRVTLVFASVEGGKLFAARSRKNAADVNTIIASIIYDTLIQVGLTGCRVEGVLGGEHSTLFLASYHV